MNNSQKITPFLWFDNNADEAVRFYLTVFKNSSAKGVSRYDAEGSEVSGMPEGSVMTIPFEIEGQEFIALNGGPVFKFTEAVSFVINCESQEEIDHYWNSLTEGGQESQCGWLKDKFGLSWQVVPRILGILLQHENKEKASRVMDAMLKMKKINIEKLNDAAED